MGWSICPFDKAVREAKHLLGGNGYLSNQEYRQLYREGRITAEGVMRALRRVGPRVAGHIGDQSGSWRIEASDVVRAHLLFGIEPLESTLSWTFGQGGADAPVSARSSARVQAAHPGTLEAAKADHRATPRKLISAICGKARWRPSRFADERVTEAPSKVALPAQRTVGDWLDTLAGASIVERINDQMAKWVAAFVDEGMAGWEMPSRRGGFYQAWRDLAPIRLVRPLSRYQGFLGEGSRASGIARGCHHRSAWSDWECRQSDGPSICPATSLSCPDGPASFAGWARTPLIPVKRAILPIRSNISRYVCSMRSSLPMLSAAGSGAFLERCPTLVSHWQEHPDEYQSPRLRRARNQQNRRRGDLPAGMAALSSRRSSSS